MRAKTFAAVLLSILLSMTMFFSVLYIASESAHHCTGEECPICAEINACVQLLNSVALAALLSCVLSAVCDNKIIFAVKRLFVSRITLVSLRVKLSN